MKDRLIILFLGGLMIFSLLSLLFVGNAKTETFSISSFEDQDVLFSSSYYSSRKINKGFQLERFNGNFYKTYSLR